MDFLSKKQGMHQEAHGSAEQPSVKF